MTERSLVAALIPEWRRSQTDDDPLPPDVRQKFLAVPEHEHEVLRSLKPYWIALPLADLARSPGQAGFVEAFYLVKRIRSYFVEERHAKVIPTPRREELEAKFGEDALLVESLWPVVAFLDLAEEVAASGDDSDGAMRAYYRVWEESRILLLLLNPIVGRHSDWSDTVRSLLRETARNRGESVDNILAGAFVFLREHAGAFLNYVPSGDVKHVMAYVATAIRRNLMDTPADDIDSPIGIDVQRMSDEGLTKEIARRLSPVTKRKYRRAGLVPARASEDDYERVRGENEAKQRHQSHRGKTVSVAARELGRNEATVRKALQEEIAASGERPEMANGFYALTDEWVARVRRRVNSKRQRGHIDGLTPKEFAGKHGLSHNEVVRALRLEIQQFRESPPKVARVYRLNDDWIRRISLRIRS